MGASNCPETPRQKMIGMMYLMLTCMLALNISKEVLDAFIVVNKGLEATNETFTQKNAFMYSALDAAKANDPKKVGPYYDAALKAKEMSEDLDKYVKELKIELFMLADGKPREEAEKADIKHLDAKDNVDKPHYLLIGESIDGSAGKARELKNKLNKFKEDLIALLNDPKIDIPNKPKEIEKLGDLGINTSDNPDASPDKPFEKYWETNTFAEIPLAAVICMLSQIQNQVKNAEATIINKLLSSIGASDFKFDTIAPRIVPKSNYIVAGDNYEAELFIAAFSTTDKPKIYVGAGYDSTKGELTGKIDSVSVERGVGKYIIQNPGIGAHTFSAIIQVKNPVTNDYKTFPIKVGGSYNLEYMVAKPQAVISPTKMNVLYIGVPNPIDISVSGFRADQISANISQGSLSKGSTGYIAQVKTVGKANISVSVKDDNGKVRPMGSMEFRVKRVPDPVPKVANMKSGSISKSLLLSQIGVKADLENFDFDLKFDVVGFTVSATIKGFEESKTSNSSRITPEQLALIQKIPNGQSVYFSDVKCKRPDGVISNIGTIKLKIQ
jgi:gliding motility-associated protein GldM